jgi:tRNA threonylcarbamoyladenosine biosynthesis protein TsaE
VSVYHIDLYRLETLQEVSSLGLDEIFDRPAVVLLEWAERFPQILPTRRIEVHIRRMEDNAREIKVSLRP